MRPLAPVVRSLSSRTAEAASESIFEDSRRWTSWRSRAESCGVESEPEDVGGTARALAEAGRCQANRGR